MDNEIQRVYTVFVDELSIGIIRKNSTKCYDSPTRSSIRRLSRLLDWLTYRGDAKASIALQANVAPMAQWYLVRN